MCRNCRSGWVRSGHKIFRLGWLGLDGAHRQKCLKPRLYQQQCRSNIVECYKSNDLSTKSNVTLTLLPLLAIMSNEFFAKFRPFDKVETSCTCSISFDFVERTKYHEKLVRYCCQKRQQCRSNVWLCRSNI